MRALLVHNPTAGTKGHDKDSIVDALRLADFKVDYVSTKEDRVKSALKEKYDLVVAAGGDGTCTVSLVPRGLSPPSGRTGGYARCAIARPIPAPKERKPTAPTTFGVVGAR